MPKQEANRSQGRTDAGVLLVADPYGSPFDVKVPNADTQKAIAELEAGKGRKFASVEDLMADLHADG